jgi:anthranilate synthase/aminodeoxychorismate synthase-like glutamine amidotransferase
MVHDVLLIDHYDSFTRNVLGWLDPGDGLLRIRTIAFDDPQAMESAALSSAPLILSPGPRHPSDAAPTLALVAKRLGSAPIIGICLGHQLLAVHAGARIARDPAPFHGSTRAITPAASAIFRGISQPFAAAVYNSLTVDPQSIPSPWIIAATGPLGEVQAIAFEPPHAAPAYGLQFHPESYLSEGAALLRGNILAILDAHASATAPLSDPS